MSAAFFSAAVNLFALSLPAHLMAYFPFRDRLRFPLWKALALTCLIQLAQSLVYGWVVCQGGPSQLVSYGAAPIYMAVYFSSVRDNRFKVLFLYLFITDYVMILRGVSAFLEAKLLPSAGMTFTSWLSTALNLALLALSAPLMLQFFASARQKAFSVEAPRFWATAWMVPAFTTAIVMLFTADLSADRVGSLSFLFARVMLLLCAFVVYSTLLDALDGIRRQAALAEQTAMQEHLLNLQRAQHEQLLKHMEEVKAARHDLRQHLEVIWAYLDGGDVDGLKTYLRSYAQNLPADIRRTFTKNFALNAVCTYYAEQARKDGIDCDIALNLPERLPFREPEICALLGNLLENAVEACRLAEDSPFIRARALWEDGHLALTVDNRCTRPPRWQDGRLLSSKRPGFGSGTWAVQKTAERAGGSAQFRCQDGVFYASVLLES